MDESVDGAAVAVISVVDTCIVPDVVNPYVVCGVGADVNTGIEVGFVIMAEEGKAKRLCKELEIDLNVTAVSFWIKTQGP